MRHSDRAGRDQRDDRIRRQSDQTVDRRVCDHYVANAIVRSGTSRRAKRSLRRRRRTAAYRRMHSSGIGVGEPDPDASLVAEALARRVPVRRTRAIVGNAASRVTSMHLSDCRSARRRRPRWLLCHGWSCPSTSGVAREV